MAALPPVPGVAKVVMEGTLSGIPIATVFHMAYTGPPLSGLDALGLATVVAGQWGAIMCPNICNNAQWLEYTVEDLSSETGATAIFEASHQGSHAGTPAPNNVQMVISKAIARRYRGGRPRTYIPGLPESNLDTPTHWNAAFAVTVANAWSTFIQDISGTTSAPTVSHEVCVHYVKNGLPLPAPLVDATQGAVARTLVGTLRRRLT